MKRTVFIVLLSLFSAGGLWAQKAGTGTVVRVLTFNIFHGETTTGSFDLDRIAQVISDADPDFVALQEVDFKTNRAHKKDLATELGWRVKMAPLFGRAMYYDGGEYGEAILSKYTFLSFRNVALPFTPGHEPRAAIEITTVLSSGDTIAFVATHLDHLPDDQNRIAQVRKINETFSRNSYPTILAGDMNARPGSEPIKLLESVWGSSYDKTRPQPTYPSNNPLIKLDYVMFHPPERWKVLERTAIQDSVASDHCAYLVLLELLKK